MYTEINAALQSVKVISEWLKANKSLKNYNELVAAVSEVNSKLISTQGIIISCYEKQKTLTDRITDLEKEIAQAKNFNREVERYALHEFKSGVLAYALKQDKANGNPMHYLCNNCMENGKLSKPRPALNKTRYICQTCKMHVIA